MAKMIPSQAPQETSSPAEPHIYELLRDGLSSDYTVIHSLPWLCAAVHEVCGWRPPTGEIDFLVIHEELGVLALEVKGGRYRIEGVAFVRQDGRASTNPVTQTRDNVHGFARWLRNRHPRLSILPGYGFVFPDSEFGDKLVSAALVDVSIDPPARIVVDKPQLKDIARRVVEMMKYWHGALDGPKFGASKARQLIKTLCPDFDGEPSWATRVAFDSHFWLRLTSEQAAVVERVLQRQATVVTGWPGTGKTLIGIEVARRLASTGQRVLFLTYNSLLSQYLESQLRSVASRCRVSTWHSLCATARGDLGKPDENDSKEWYVTECFEDLKAANLLGDYDALILDEAQALQPSWCDWLGAQFEGKFALACCDETQVFAFEKTTTSLARLRQSFGVEREFELSVVLRMPRTVLDRLLSVKESFIQLTSPRKAEANTLVEYLVLDWTDALKKLLRKFEQKGVDPSEVVFLSRLEDVGTVDLLRLAGAGRFRHRSVSRFRGLEAPIVVALHAESMTEVELFSAYSRATSAFYALFDANELGKKVEGRFQTTLMLDEGHQLRAQAGLRRQLTSTALSAHVAECGRVGTQTVKLAWSARWSAWLVELDHEHDPALGWIDHLVSSHPWPVYHWHGRDERVIRRCDPLADAKSDINSRYCRLRHCEPCAELTPHSLDASGRDTCDICDRAASRRSMSQHDPAEAIRSLMAWDEVMCRSPQTPTAGLKRHLVEADLPLALAAAAKLRQAWAGPAGAHLVEQERPEGKSVMNRAALAFVLAHIAELKPHERLVRRQITAALVEQYRCLQGDSPETWARAVSFAINRFFNARGLLTKVSDGVYISAIVPSEDRSESQPR